VPTLVAGLAVGYRPASAPPWRDEFASWSAATRDVPEIFALGRHIDGVLVPYYLFLHFWVGLFGDSVLAMRVPSMLAMTAAAGVVALLGRHRWGDAAGLFGGLLFAVLPVVSRYGQEARGYAFAVLFATVATLLLARALDRSGRWAWAAYGASVALMGLSHLLSLLLLAGHLAIVAVAVWRGGRRRALWWVLAVAIGVAATLPLTVRGLGQQSAQLSWLHRASPSALADISGTIFEAPVLGGAVAGLAVAGLRRVGAGSLWAAVLLPVGLLYAYDQLVAPIFLGRYLLFCVPLLCALAGAGLAALRPPAALAVIAVVAACGLPVQQSIRRSHSDYDYRAAARVVEGNEQPGDGIIYAPRDGWQLVDLGLEYYLRDRAPRDLLLKTGEVANDSLWATECDDPAACLAGTGRIWEVAADNLDPQFQATSTNQLTDAQISALNGYEQIGIWRVDGFTIALFAHR
jgi:mannosyltransferase